MVSLFLFMGRAAVRVAGFAALLVILGGVYWKIIRPFELHWGATPEEITRPLPEDDIVRDPAFDATRAITIRARPDKIWPWLAQMGYGHAGFYGYDLIENPGSRAGLRSARTIFPRWQHPRTGDLLPLSIAATLQYGTIDPPRILVWRGSEDPPSGVFIWALIPMDAAHTRLISRIRWRYPDDPRGRALDVFTEFADHVAIRAILKGVRDRVEGQTPPSLVVQGFEIAGWLVAFAVFAETALLVLLRGRWGVAWLNALASGLLIFFVLYGGAPPWIDALLPWLWLAVLGRRRIRSVAARLTVQRGDAHATVRVP